MNEHAKRTRIRQVWTMRQAQTIKSKCIEHNECDPTSCWFIKGFVIVHVRLCSFQGVKRGRIFAALQTLFTKQYCVVECFGLIKFEKIMEWPDEENWVQKSTDVSKDFELKTGCKKVVRGKNYKSET